MHCYRKKNASMVHVINVFCFICFFFVERNVELSFYHTYVYTFKDIITEILTVYS